MMLWLPRLSFWVNSLIEELANNVYRLELTSHTLPPYKTTNSYLLASDKKAIIIDPGFYQEESLEKINELLNKNKLKLKAILLTHTHRDHIEGMDLLVKTYPEINIYLHYKEKHKLPKELNIGTLKHNEYFQLGKLKLKAIFTPGHSRGHLSFYLQNEKIAFVGDLLAKNSSTWVGTPEGSVQDYLNSLDKLARLELKLLAAGHGKTINTPYIKIEHAKNHRLERLEQIINALKNNSKGINELRDSIYPNLSARLEPFATRSLKALLVKLIDDGIVAEKKESYSLLTKN